jgi:hypothetical protein
LLSRNGVYANLISNQLTEANASEKDENKEPSSLQNSFYLNRSTLQLVDRHAMEEEELTGSSSLEVDNDFLEQYEFNRPKIGTNNNNNSANPFVEIGDLSAPPLVQNSNANPIENAIVVDLNTNNNNNTGNNNSDDGSDFDWGAAITII